MIVAGIGCRKGCSGAAVVSTISHALAAHGLTPEALDRLATGEIKRGEAGIADAAQTLNLPLDIMDDGTLEAAKNRCLTHSLKSIERTGVASLSEAAALAATGKAGRLLGPRIARDGVTCALAQLDGDV